jgi:hypothetical protein
MPAGQDAGDYSLLSERERAEFAALAESFQAEKSGLLAVEVPWSGDGGFLVTEQGGRERIVLSGREAAGMDGDLAYGTVVGADVREQEEPVVAERKLGGEPGDHGDAGEGPEHPVFSLGGLAAALAARPVIVPVAAEVAARVDEGRPRLVLQPAVLAEEHGVAVPVAEPWEAAVEAGVEAGVEATGESGLAVGALAGAGDVAVRDEGGDEMDAAGVGGAVLADEEASWGSTGLLVAGGLLILAGLYLVRAVVLFAVQAGGERGLGKLAAGSWEFFRVHAGMVVAAAGGLLLLLLGTGAVAHRRWAPPLIHALGWVLVLFALSYAGVAAAAAFYLMGSAQELPAVSFLGGRELLLGVLLLVVVPLGLIGVCQREDTAEACAATQRSRSWTDARPVPVLMTFLTALGGVVLAGAMLSARAAFPAFGEFLGGGDAVAAWGAVLVVSAVAVLLTGFQRKLGWWLQMGLFLVLAPAVFLTLRVHGWDGLPGGGAAVGQGALRTAVAGAGALFPVFLILLMARKAFDLRPVAAEER